MKTKYLLLFILLICSLTSKAEEKTVTFDASVDRTSEAAISKEGISITAITNAGNPGGDFDADTKTYGKHYSIASGSTAYISSTVGYITNVQIKYVAKTTVPSISEESTGEFSKNTKWTGYATSFNFFMSGHGYISSISVTYDRSITMSSSTYATFWCEKAYTMPTGLMGYTISGVEDGCVIKGQTYDAGSLVPANTPLMLRGNAGSYAYTTSDDDSPVPTPNLLRCSDGTEISEDGSLLYKYTYLSSTDHTLGFFRHSLDGHTMKVDYGKAYLAIPDDGAAGAKSLTLNDNWDVTDGIERSVTAEECENDIEQTLYDIHGVVHPKAESLKEGIYITKTGRKIVVRK